MFFVLLCRIGSLADRVAPTHPPVRLGRIRPGGNLPERRSTWTETSKQIRTLGRLTPTRRTGWRGPPPAEVKPVPEGLARDQGGNLVYEYDPGTPSRVDAAD